MVSNKTSVFFSEISTDTDFNFSFFFLYKLNGTEELIIQFYKMILKRYLRRWVTKTIFLLFFFSNCILHVVMLFFFRRKYSALKIILVNIHESFKYLSSFSRIRFEQLITLIEKSIHVQCLFLFSYLPLL